MLDRITKDIIEAMKSHDTLKLQTLRMLKGAVDLEKINKKLDKVSDEDIVVIIGKQIPAGTGAKKYQSVEFDLEADFSDDEPFDVLEEKLGE